MSANYNEEGIELWHANKNGCSRSLSRVFVRSFLIPEHKIHQHSRAFACPENETVPISNVFYVGPRSPNLDIDSGIKIH